MKAVIRTFYGSPDVLEVKEVERPIAGNNEILVRVYFATVNRTDCSVLTGKPFIIRFFTGIRKPKLQITGTDFSGEIVGKGKDVTNFEIGDRVWGFHDNGLTSHAAFTAINVNRAVVRIPPNTSYEDAAASAEAAHYAYNFINKVSLLKGQKVMVNGGTGAIGSAVIQILKFFGIYVAATCRGEHMDKVKLLGADKVIDYLTEDFTKDDEKYDFVFDAVGKSTFGKCRPIMVKKGIYISSEFGPYFQNPILALITPFFRRKKVIFPIPINVKGSLRFIQKLLESNHFKPLIDREYPVDEAREAYKYVQSGQKIGNVLLNLNQA